MNRKYRPGEELQTLVKRIEDALSGDENTTVESPAYLLDKRTGGRREHDVLITQKLPHRTHITAIECKDHKRPVGVPIVEAFRSKCEDTGLNKAVIVSSRGFASTAMTKAKKYGIDCLTLQAAKRSDWRFIYEFLQFNRKILSRQLLLKFYGVAVEPVRLFMRRPDSQGIDLQKDEPGWMDDRFRELHEGKLLESGRQPGKDRRQVIATIQSPLDHLYVVDRTGATFNLTSMDLIFTYDETRTLMPIERHSYGDPLAAERFEMISADLRFSRPDGQVIVQVTVIDFPDGSHRIKQSPNVEP